MERITKLFDNKTVKVLAGDLTAGDWEFNMGILWGGFDQVNLTTDLKAIKVETEESAKNVAQTLGWAVVGNLVFGPLGLIAGLTMGGNRKQVCAMCELTDNRKFLAIMDAKIYQQMMALTMSRSS